MKNVISIHGAPRSGTSWLGQLFDSSPETRYKFQPLFSYTFKDYINLHSSPQDIEHFFQSVYSTDDHFLDQQDKKEKGYYPVFENKDNDPDFLVMKMVRYHYLIQYLLTNSPELQVIGIVRNPCGVMNSWRKAPREFLQEWDFNEEWYFGTSKNKFRPEEYYGFHRWKEQAHMFLWLQKNFPQQFKLIRYEDLVGHTEDVVKDLFSFVELPMNDQTQRFIEKSKSVHQDDVYSVYKGNKEVDDWKNELDISIINKIKSELLQTELEHFIT
ncbi:sulfotransferase family protein [Salibacterium halotolerans]|uniref:Sulfotransferase family protein n=1 Tax=Salibacterium halotolerans TaxID=1884432 RepID=A0A1I5XVQ6_9BACI|nr:sulfotransferase [Salibacterium halotolerans]SFQ35994.1 Sulfotransferase family protein [Salibacterium halotolerans]